MKVSIGQKSSGSKTYGERVRTFESVTTLVPHTRNNNSLDMCKIDIIDNVLVASFIYARRHYLCNILVCLIDLPGIFLANHLPRKGWRVVFGISGGLTYEFDCVHDVVAYMLTNYRPNIVFTCEYNNLRDAYVPFIKSKHMVYYIDTPFKRYMFNRLDVYYSVRRDGVFCKPSEFISRFVGWGTPISYMGYERHLVAFIAHPNRDQRRKNVKLLNKLVVNDQNFPILPQSLDAMAVGTISYLHLLYSAKTWMQWVTASQLYFTAISYYLRMPAVTVGDLLQFFVEFWSRLKTYFYKEEDLIDDGISLPECSVDQNSLDADEEIYGKVQRMISYFMDNRTLGRFDTYDEALRTIKNSQILDVEFEDIRLHVMLIRQDHRTFAKTIVKNPAHGKY